MRRRIELYIGGRRADINDQGFILYNYAATDLDKPSAVRNSYSKQVTLPGTPANDAIFSHSYRVDRLVAPDTFNPLVRTPFTIYSEAGEILQSGYIKLDRIDRKGSDHSFVITLYGGLGSLIYGLTYDGEGNALTLASLAFSVDDASFYATINKDTIAAAWNALYSGTGNALWDIINFAPCYNGLPDKLASNKARIQGSYSTPVELSRKFTEWETRDLRSYLQRPALRVKAVLDAIVSKAAALGKTLVLDPAFFNANNPYYTSTWMLLPMLTSYENSSAGQIGEPSTVDQGFQCEGMEEIATGGTVKLTGSTFTSAADGTIDFSGFNPSFFLKGNITLTFRFRNSNNQGFFGYLNYWDAENSVWKGSLLALQVVARAGGTVLAKSKPIVYGQWNGSTDARWQTILSMVDTSQGYSVGGNYLGPSTLAYINLQNIPVAAANNVKIQTEMMVVSDDAETGESSFLLYESETSSVDPFAGNFQLYTDGGQFTLNSPGSVGTNVTITKDMLLNGTSSPASFLLSYCRQYGLKIVQTGPDEISILSRGSFFNGDTYDLTPFVDRSNTKVVPLPFTKKWQKLGLDIIQSSAAQDYRKEYGKEYGNISLDTGLEFNAETEDLMSGSAFKGGVSGRWKARTLNDFYDEYSVWINPALVPGYTDETGEHFPVTTTTVPLNADFPGYDLSPKPFGFTEDRNELKAVDLSGMLVFLNGIITSPGMWWITDDYPDNNNGPCWQMPTLADSYAVKVAYLPVFSRYYERTAGQVALSLDFATPAEIFDPNTEIDPSSSIYTRFWEKYLVDLYDKSGKVLTAKVNFVGIKVGPELLRRFFFYEGSIWVLNKITNYSLTTWDPVECEFIQVQDQNNYTNGQTL